MGFLSPEAEADLISRLDDSNNNNEQGEEWSSEASASAETNDEIEGSSASPNESSEEVESQSTEESGHAVPYSRFQQVIHARNHLRDEHDALKEQLEALQAQMEQANSVKSPPRKRQEKVEDDDAWLDDIWSDDEVEVASMEPQDDGRYSSLEDKIYQLEVHKETLALQTELQQVSGVYPDVPEEVLLQAVIQNPDISVMDVAERYNAFVSQVEEQAIARYASENQVAPPAAPSRPASAGRGTSSFAGVKKPRTLEDAKKATLAYLKSL